jgi:outer membrane protein W
LRVIVAVFVFVLLGSTPALAQYKNNQFGFELGYSLFDRPLLDESGPHLGFRVGYQLTDRWWLGSRVAFSYRKQLPGLPNTTVFLLQATPLSGRYYFATHRWRPFLGAGTTFTFVLNGSASGANWGPNALGGIEIRIAPDVFLGLQVDYGYVVTEPRGSFLSAVAQTTVYF